MGKAGILTERPEFTARTGTSAIARAKPSFSKRWGPGNAITAVLARLATRKLLAIKIALLLALLICHFLTRQQTAQTLAGQSEEFYYNTSNYPQYYRASLALIAGKGFRNLAWPESPDTPGTDSQVLLEAKPILEFLNLQRPRVSPEEFDALLHTSQVGTTATNPFQRSRVLDLYLTALIWKWFGISWPIYYVFSSLASTFTCLFIFLITCKLSGSYWAGICASLLFLASPFENQFCIRSLRDISPLWFGTMAFAFFTCCVDNFRSRKWNYLSFLVLGILAMVGRGWRVDVLLLIPFLLIALLVYLILRRRGWLEVFLGGCLFVGGAWTTDRFIRALCPGGTSDSGVVFHIALYGDSSRCNLMGLENSFQIPRDDIHTVFNACCYNEGKNPDHPLVIHRYSEYERILLDYYKKEYGLVCQDMFSAALKYHLYQYLTMWPEFYFQALAAFPEPQLLQGESLPLLQKSRLPWALPIYDWCLDPLTRFLPYLHVLGILTLFLTGTDKIRGTFLVLFSIYYAVAWFAVLPEQKHLGQLLLPLTVTGGMGIWGLARACRFLFLRGAGPDLPLLLPLSFRIACGLALAAIGCWALACALAYPYSVRHRQNYLNDIRALAVHGQEAPETIKDRRVFSTYLDPQETLSPTGYLLTIQAVSHPGFLTCRHVHFPSWRLPGRIFTTRHKLYPNQVQYFAVSCLHAAKYGDIRPYACTVMLNPGSWIVSCKRLDLSTWKRLPFSTIYCDEDPIPTPGSPVVGRFSSDPTDPGRVQFLFNNLSSEIAYWYPWKLLSVLGLPCEQNFEYPGLNPIRLAADFETNGEGLLHSPANWDQANQSGLPWSNWDPQPGVKFSPGPEGKSWKVTAEESGTSARYSPLTVAEDGVYLFKLKYRPVRGELSFQALSLGLGSSLRQFCQSTQEGDDLVLALEVNLKAGEPFQLEIASHRPAGDRHCQFFVKEVQAYREKNPLWELVRKP